MLSINLILTLIAPKCVDPYSRQMGIAASSILPAVMQNVLLEVVMRFVRYLNAPLFMHLATGDIEGFPGGEIERTGSNISLGTFIQAEYLLLSCVSQIDKTKKRGENLTIRVPLVKILFF